TESAYITKMNKLKAAIDSGLEDAEQGRTKSFTADQFATYLSERTETIIDDKRST
ncbi:MAG: Uncharacterized protein AWU57_3045, partial [Marinobacter sp. T13-3]